MDEAIHLPIQSESTETDKRVVFYDDPTASDGVDAESRTLAALLSIYGQIGPSGRFMIVDTLVKKCLVD